MPAALYGRQPGEKLSSRKGLGDVVVGPGLQRGDFPPLLVSNRQDQHRGIAPFAQALQNLQAIHVRQAEIEQHHLRPVDRTGLQAELAVLRLMHLIAFRLQREPEQPADLDFIIDDKRGHNRSEGRQHGGRRFHGLDRKPHDKFGTARRMIAGDDLAAKRAEEALDD